MLHLPQLVFSRQHFFGIAFVFVCVASVLDPLISYLQVSQARPKSDSDLNERIDAMLRSEQALRAIAPINPSMAKGSDTLYTMVKQLVSVSGEVRSIDKIGDPIIVAGLIRQHFAVRIAANPESVGSILAAFHNKLPHFRTSKVLIDAQSQGTSDRLVQIAVEGETWSVAQQSSLQ